jgi:hypothetical protein
MTTTQHAALKRGAADLAIDFGTANTRIYVRGSGIVFEEPSLCCFSDETWEPKLLAVGEAVTRIVGRTSGPLRIARPLARGVLNDIEAVLGGTVTLSAAALEPVPSPARELQASVARAFAGPDRQTRLEAALEELTDIKGRIDAARARSAA